MGERLIWDDALARRDGFLRVAAATPKIRVGDVDGNADAIIATVISAAEAGVRVLALPELCLTGYTCADLFHDRALVVGAERALARIIDATADLSILFTVGVPVAWRGSLYNCVAVVSAGELVGLTAKESVPTYGEFYEGRWFAPAPSDPEGPIEVSYAGFRVPLAARLIYRCTDAGLTDIAVGVEVCEDLWVSCPPSIDMARRGAVVLLNASASDEVIGKAAYRRQLVSGQSARLFAAYAYADAGAGESTTDLVFAGANLVAENGSVLAETERFTCDRAQADVDIERLLAERQRTGTWTDIALADDPLEVAFTFGGMCEPEEALEDAWGEEDGLFEDEYDDLFDGGLVWGDDVAVDDDDLADGDRFSGDTGDPAADDLGRDSDDDEMEGVLVADDLVRFGDRLVSFALPEDILRDADEVDRVFPRAPFVPDDERDLTGRCEEILNLQAAGLATRLSHTGTKRAVIGLSGGLDSTLALLVTVRAFDMLGFDHAGITAISMPGFGTTTRTKGNAQTLAETLGTTFREISIHAAVEQHFRDIGHDPALTDVTYENSQARERTQILMDVANSQGAFVIGTGDLSELALGWATYNGDHMSMYGVNASVPKTLVRHLVRYAAGVFGGAIEATLLDILDTPVSPELLPPTGDGQIAQRTEDLVGPYELHDYFLYYLLRFGFAPGKIFRMACRSFAGVYDERIVYGWLRVFYRRFFAQQFKRSCLPDGPKVGSVTLSPRGDWRMPSDAAAHLWLEEVDELDPDRSESEPAAR